MNRTCAKKNITKFNKVLEIKHRIMYTIHVWILPRQQSEISDPKQIRPQMVNSWKLKLVLCLRCKIQETTTYNAPPRCSKIFATKQKKKTNEKKETVKSFANLIQYDTRRSYQTNSHFVFTTETKCVTNVRWQDYRKRLSETIVQYSAWLGVALGWLCCMVLRRKSIKVNLISNTWKCTHLNRFELNWTELFLQLMHVWGEIFVLFAVSLSLLLIVCISLQFGAQHTQPYETLN